MRRTLLLFLALLLCLTMMGCHPEEHVQIATTTAPVYEFTSRLCAGTQISVGLIISESVSCLHDYTLQTGQMRMLESAQLLILSGAGLEEFLSDTIPADKTVIDASAAIHLLCPETEHDHEHEDHHHEQDPHIWLNPANAAIMAKNICAGLQTQYPDHSEQFEKNLTILLEELDALDQYGKKQLSSLGNRQLITFHDGFAYLADAYNLAILHAIEEESGSEASAGELIELCKLIRSHDVPAIFTEQNGSTSAAKIISSEMGVPIYTLDMAMSRGGYFQSMYRNIDTLKEALG